MSRRQFIFLGVGAVGGLGAISSLERTQNVYYLAQEFFSPRRDFSVSQTQSLRERAAAKGLIFGAAATTTPLSTDKAFAAVFAKECNALVPENQLKWKVVHPQPDRYDFSLGDQLLNFAQQHQMQFRGHPLVWHQNLPTWLRERITRRNAEKLMTDHIQAVAKHYAGKVHSWDVVNEAILPSDNQPNGFRNTIWYQSMGERYVETAFRAAAEADPNALLVYNDFDLEDGSLRQSRKRGAVLALLDRLKAKGTPIHVLGLQMHWRAWDDRFDPTVLQQFLSDVASMGLKMMITEMDVADRRLPLTNGTRDRIVAGIYEDLLSVAFSEPAVIGLLTWGLSDRYTWLSQYQPRRDRSPVRPLPLDAQLQRKLAWSAIARSFDRAPMRSMN